MPRTARSARWPMYYGAYPGENSAGTKLATFESDSRKPVSMVMNYQAWGDTTNNPPNVFSAWDNIRTHGSIPMITWEPWAPGNPTNAAYTCAAIAAGTNTLTYNGSSTTYDAYVTAWATYIASTWQKPLFLRFMHEFNISGTYPWDQGNGNSAANFVAAWQHVWNIFQANGANTYVSWVWTPNIAGSYASPNIASFYPGDSYVDWLGFDGYNNIGGSGPGTGTWTTATNLFGPFYTYVLANVTTTKPFFWTELACVESGGDKAAWLADLLTSAIWQWPQLHGVSYFNDAGSGTDPWRIETSSAAQQAYISGVGNSNVLTNTFGSISAKPGIPTLSRTTASARTTAATRTPAA